MKSASPDLEAEIRTSLRRTAGQAPPADDLLGRVRAAASEGGEPERTRRGAWSVGLAAASVAAVMVASVAVLELRDVGPGGLAEHPVVVPANPSIRPDFALCDSLADKVGGDDGGDLVRAVTVTTSRLERSLTGPLSTYEHLDASAATTTVCVFETAPQPVPGPPRPDSDGVQVLAQSADRWDVRSIGPVQSVFADLDPLQREIREEFDNRPTDGVGRPKEPGEPCHGAEPATLPRSDTDRAHVLVPHTTVANQDNLVSVWTCGFDIPALHYPGVDIYFEDGYSVPPDEWKRAVDEWGDSYVVSVGDVPTLVSHPVDGTLGEVMYIRDGHLMRVLGDGSVPADQLLEVVTSSEPLGDQTLP